MIRRAGTGMRDQKNEEREKGNQDIIRMQKSREEKLFLCTSVFIITFAFLATQGIWPYIILILQINVLMNNHSLSFLRAGSKTQISFVSLVMFYYMEYSRTLSKKICSVKYSEAPRLSCPSLGCVVQGALHCMVNLFIFSF